MGLDMYLNRYPRFKNATPENVSDIECFFNWKKAKAEDEKYANYTLKEWCNVEEEDLLMEAIPFYEPHYQKKFSDWDKEKKYGYFRVVDNVGYWRKANQIHNWFVREVQNGCDECGTYVVSEYQLQKLLDICQKIIANPSCAENELPTTCGFFFGSTEYDEWYFSNIKDTIRILTEVLKSTDFEKEVITYHASW